MSRADNPLADPRPAASLTGSLLARRGSARPAMRRPTLGGVQISFPTGFTAEQQSDDLGWNDMGDVEVTAPAAVPVPIAPGRIENGADAAPVSPAKQQLQSLAEQMSIRLNVTRKPKRAQPASLVVVARKSAFTLRLDPERHLRLRLLSAVSKRSAQQLLVEAIDAMVAGNEQVIALAEELESRAADGKSDVDAFA